jgi:hypothetical protein
MQDAIKKIAARAHIDWEKDFLLSFLELVMMGHLSGTDYSKIKE